MQNIDVNAEADQLKQWLDFKNKLMGLWDVLRRHGVQKPAITDKNFRHFIAMGPAKCEQVSRFITQQIHIYNEAEELDIDFGDTPELLKVALQVMGMGVDKRLFETLHRDDIVELYSIEHLQLFRSFNFFHICNYNLDDILMHEWFNLYERAQADTTQIFGQVIAHLKATESFTSFTVPKHLMKERFSEQQGVFEITFKHLASAFKGAGVREGYVATQSVRVLGVVERARVKIVES